MITIYIVFYYSINNIYSIINIYIYKIYINIIDKYILVYCTVKNGSLVVSLNVNLGFLC